MFQPIDPRLAADRLKRFANTRLYLHFEFTRGGFLRNLTVDVEEAVLRGDGPYRIALRCREQGWVIMEGLTLMAEEGSVLAFGALDEDQKLTQTLQLSREAFTP